MRWHLCKVAPGDRNTVIDERFDSRITLPPMGGFSHSLETTVAKQDGGKQCNMRNLSHFTEDRAASRNLGCFFKTHLTLGPALSLPRWRTFGLCFPQSRPRAKPKLELIATSETGDLLPHRGSPCPGSQAAAGAMTLPREPAALWQGLGPRTPSPVLLPPCSPRLGGRLGSQASARPLAFLHSSLLHLDRSQTGGWHQGYP